MNKVLIDCDPGIDDALAIALAQGSPDLEIVGITTVGGNVDLHLTTANALALREFLDLGDVPVTPGSADALLRPRIRAAHVHGANGLADVILPEPTRAATPGHAADFIISTLRDAPGEITLVAIGPLTNLALAVRREPRVLDWARDLVIMGGSYTRGNHTPAAEFNIHADPESAAIVFSAGRQVTMIGLDVTQTALVTTSVLKGFTDLGRLSDLVLPCCQYYGVVTASGGPALHDACAIAYVIDPTLMHCVPAHVQVETQGLHTFGMTVTDFTPVSHTPNALVATTLDVPRFWDLMTASYTRLGTHLG